jgi:hypothetical protein
MTEPAELTPESDSGLLFRPPMHLHDFPIEARWELTRRHPYYLIFWELASLYRQNKLSDGPAQEGWGMLALNMLSSIGVHGVPISPESDFEKLIEGDHDPTFLTGSVQPISIRAIMVMLLSALPRPEQEILACLLTVASSDEYRVEEDDEGRSLQRQLAVVELAKMTNVVFDSTPDVPLFFVHLQSSQRSIIRDMEDQVRFWKKKRNLGNRKVHPDKYKDYLAVWDLREGWTGSGYDRSKELTFAEVARRLHEGSISSTANRYKSAFQMIVGHGFSPETWWRLFGHLQFSEFSSDSRQILAAPLRRRFRSNIPRPVPDSQVSPTPSSSNEARATGIVEMRSVVEDDIDWTDLRMDLEDLIDKGLSDEAIAKKLELSSSGVVADFRMRMTDFRSI